MSGTPSPTEAHWIRGAVGRFEGPLTLYAARLLGDAETARDVVQETFLRLCVQDRARVERHLAEWLFTVCRHRALDVLRKEGRMSRLSDERVQAHADPVAAPATFPSPVAAARLMLAPSPGGTCCTCTWPWPARIAARSITFRNSRTLPGH